MCSSATIMKARQGCWNEACKTLPGQIRSLSPIVSNQGKRENWPELAILETHYPGAPGSSITGLRKDYATPSRRPRYSRPCIALAPNAGNIKSTRSWSAIQNTVYHWGWHASWQANTWLWTSNDQKLVARRNWRRLCIVPRVWIISRQCEAAKYWLYNILHALHPNSP